MRLGRSMLCVWLYVWLCACVCMWWSVCAGGCMRVCMYMYVCVRVRSPIE